MVIIEIIAVASTSFIDDMAIILVGHLLARIVNAGTVIVTGVDVVGAAFVHLAGTFRHWVCWGQKCSPSACLEQDFVGIGSLALAALACDLEELCCELVLNWRYSFSREALTKRITMVITLAP